MLYGVAHIRCGADIATLWHKSLSIKVKIFKESDVL